MLVHEPRPAGRRRPYEEVPLRTPIGTGIGSVVVAGPSMLPTLRPGDCLLVRRGGRVRGGDLVVARPWTRPELLVVKRAVEPVAGGWLVAADNPAVAGLGWTGGEADVLATVLLRYWPPSGWGRPARRRA